MLNRLLVLVLYVLVLDQLLDAYFKICLCLLFTYCLLEWKVKIAVLFIKACMHLVPIPES